MSQVSPPSIPQGGVVEPHRGVMILVFGILSLLLCFIFGIVAWVMANGDIAKMDAGLMDREGRGLTQAGKICGIVSVALNVIAILLYVVVVVIFGVAMAAGAAGGAGGGGGG